MATALATTISIITTIATLKVKAMPLFIITATATLAKKNCDGKQKLMLGKTKVFREY